jgi:hypothetical protein
MTQIFAHNSLLMSEKCYLIFEKKRDNQAIIPLSGEGGIRTPGTFDSTPDFESGTLNRSDTSPYTPKRFDNFQKVAKSDSSIGGEGGIRTLDTLLKYTHFPGVLFRPLRHLSVNFGLQR